MKDVDKGEFFLMSKKTTEQCVRHAFDSKAVQGA